MYIEHSISVIDFASAISETVDLISPTINDHHRKVTYISCCIAQEMNLPSDEIQDIVLASILHDIGAYSVDDNIGTPTLSIYEAKHNRHSILGYELLKGFAPLSNAANLIRYHHAEYDKSRQYIPIGSYIINLADRAVSLFDKNREVLEQIHNVMIKLSNSNEAFHPAAFKALRRISKVEYMWIEAFSTSFSSSILKRTPFTKEITNLKTLRSFAWIVAHIIDFKSRFTATHSSGVAAVAMELTSIAGFSERECKLMEIAGLLHDLGKLAVPSYILEKKEALNDKEFNTIKKHTYFTFAILSRIEGMEGIAAWAAHHHERQDGNGYPFRIKGDDFSKLSRIMAVADIVTALTENRPYRKGMSREGAVKTMFAMVDNGGIDKSIVDLVNEQFVRINDVRVKAQSEARREYEALQIVDRSFPDKRLMSTDTEQRNNLRRGTHSLPFQLSRNLSFK